MKDKINNESKNPSGRETFIYRKLTPVVASISPYADQIEFVFSNEDLRNIAISGPYGSGKSSLLRGIEEYYRATDLEQHPFDSQEVRRGDERGKLGTSQDRTHRFMTISLTHFDIDSSQESAETQPIFSGCPALEGECPVLEKGCPVLEVRNADGKTKDSPIEGQIINQIIHRVDRGKIPKSRFKKTKRSGVISGLLISLYVVFSILYFLSFSQDLVPSLWIAGLDSRTAITILWAVSTTVLIFVLFRRGSLKRTIKRLGVQGNEIELFDDKRDSKFDRYMDDIIYAIHESKADVVVFEDLDRFNNPEVFVKLREMNELVNETRSQERKKKIQKWAGSLQSRLGNRGRLRAKLASYIEDSITCKTEVIRFFYLVRDDLFTSRDRTKFFDYMIPVVPHMDYSNAYSSLKSAFHGIRFSPGETCLKVMAPFLDDERLLNNTLNEYFSYIDILGLRDKDYDEEHWSKLFGIVVYKNIFPVDFQELQHGKGKINKLFSKKDEIEKELRIELLQKEKEASGELDRVYGEAYSKVLLDWYKRTSVVISVCEENGYMDKLQDINSYEELDQWIDSTDEKSRQVLHKALVSIEEDTSFHEQVHSHAENQNIILDSYRKKLAELSRSGIKDLILQSEDENLSGFEHWFNLEAREDEVNDEFAEETALLAVRTLVLNGYIDETYRNYISFFRDGGLSERDHDYQVHVSAKSQIPADFELDNPIEVINEMDRSQFANPGARVHQIAEALFDLDAAEKISNLTDKRKAFLSSLEEYDGAEFCISYASSKYYSPRLFETTALEKIDITSQAFGEEYAASDEGKRIFAMRLYLDMPRGHSLFEGWADVNKFAFNDELFLALDSLYAIGIDFSELQAAWKEHIASKSFQLRFSAIDFDRVNSDALGFVYKNGYYEPNPRIIQGLLLSQHGVRLNGENGMMSVVVDSENMPLKSKIESEINFVISSLLEDGWLESEESVMCWVFNNPKLSEKIAAFYASSLPEGCIQNIESFNMKHQELFYQSGLVAKTFPNALAFYKLIDSFDEDVAKFFAEVDLNPNAPYSLDKLSPEQAANLMDSLFLSDEIDEQKFSLILEKTSYVFEEIDYDNISRSEA